MAITAKELAARLDISAAAVSMALNNKPGVSESTRERVLKAAREAGYDFSRMRTPSEKNRGTIICFLYVRHGAVIRDTSFFSSVTGGISDACRARGYDLSIQYLYEENVRQALRTLAETDTKGVILVGTEMRQEDFTPFSQFSLPLVVLDTYFEGINRDCVLINNVQGAYLATNYLISRRKQQPGYLRSSYSINNFEERADGFYKAIRHNGMATGASVVHLLAPSVEGAYADMLALIQQGEPLAGCYFADNDDIAAGAMRALKESGYRIPEDIGVVGFDNTPLCELFDPPITTIHVPKQAMGALAVKKLIDILTGPSLPQTKTELETTLVKRSSL